MNRNVNPNIPALYRIRLQEEIDDGWSEWFNGFWISKTDEGGSLLTGMVVDQAALYGLIRKVRDLGLTLVSLEREEIETREGNGI